MKKHTSFRQVQHTEEKKSKAGVYLSIFLAVVMIGGIGGVMLSNNQQGQYSFGQFSFTSSNGGWSTKIDNKQQQFYNLPQEVQTVPFDSSAKSIIKNAQAAIILLDPEQANQANAQAIDIFRYEVAQAFADKGRQIGFAVTKNSTQYPFIVLSCSNSSSYAPVLYLTYSENTSISANSMNSCITLSASSASEMVLLGDAVKYDLFGVLDEKTG